MKKPPTNEDFTKAWGEGLERLMATRGLNDLDMSEAVSNVLQLETPMMRSTFWNYRTLLRQPNTPVIMWAIAQVLGVPGRDLFPLDLVEDEQVAA